MTGLRVKWLKPISARNTSMLVASSDQYSRSAFHHDYGMIVHSNFFKRLAKKTQVYTLPENDHVRSRLTHSIEVSQIGRQLARYLISKLKNNGLIDPNVYWKFSQDFEELVASACLAHDIGHPPFGHSGAHILDQYLKSEFKLTDGFDDNKQVVHILLSNFLYENINPTGCLVASTLKKEKLIESSYHVDRSNLQALLNELGLDDRQYLSSKSSDFARHPASILMEAADDIAYICSDLEDYVDYYIQFRNDKILSDITDTLSGIPILGGDYQPVKDTWKQLMARIVQANFNEENIEIKDKLVEEFRNHLMKAMIAHAMMGIDKVCNECDSLEMLPYIFQKFANFTSHYDPEKEKSDSNLLYWQDGSCSYGEAFFEAKKICYQEFILKQRKIVEQDLAAKNILSELINALTPLIGNNYQKQYEYKFLSQSMKAHLVFAHTRPDKIDPRRAVANYIAGMSDRFCIEALSKLKPNRIFDKAS